jgi:tetratricopeptide (TPR) repeat protein
MQLEQKASQSQQQDEEFIKWLSPSYWLVEAQLSASRRQRAAGTLQWLRNLPELRHWQSRDPSSTGRTLWIRGAPGVGKSTIAAYLVDYIKLGYPDAIVAYFFCKQGQTGLTSARDILRTIAYQCIASGNSETRSALEMLKKTDFDLEKKMGVNFLFDKLLKDPLYVVKKDIYIIIDGLDEAEDNVQDDIESRPQLNILIECLASLPQVRLLVISRPPSNVTKIVPLAAARWITIRDNRDDIQTYVKGCIEHSKILQAHFEKIALDPVDYFVNRSEGIFLWVTLVLQQLSSASSRKVFETYINNFSTAPGNMDDLYASVLSRMSPDEQRWAREILKWVIVSDVNLSIPRLQEAVERSLEDEHVDFKDFLEVQCGSFLRFVGPSVSGDVTVQPIHETFRTFLLDPISGCPSNFHIDIPTSNTDLALICLDSLCTGTSQTDFTRWYSSWYWFTHVARVKDRRELVLVRIHRFFTGVGVQNWIKYFVAPWYPSRWSGLTLPAPEEEGLKATISWLAEYRGSVEGVPESTTSDEELKKSFEWMKTALDNDRELGQVLGKAAANIWLFSDVNDFAVVGVAFRLALKYYWKRENRTLDNMQELQHLTATNFTDMVSWVGISARSTIKSRNVGVGYFTLRRWEECIRCLNQHKHLNDDYQNFQNWMYLGTAYATSGDRSSAISAFERATENYPAAKSYVRNLNKYNKNANSISPVLAYYMLADAEMNTGDSIKVNKTISMAIHETLYFSPAHYDYMYYFHGNACDVEGAIKLYQKAIQLNPEELWPLYRLSEVYHMKGDFETEIATLTILSKKVKEVSPTELQVGTKYLPPPLEPTSDYIVGLEKSVSLLVTKQLAEAYKALGSYDRALELLQDSQHESPEAGILFKRMCTAVGESYKATKSFDKAIEVYRRITEPLGLQYAWYLYYVAEAYVGNGDLAGTMEVLKLIGWTGWDAWHPFSVWLQRRGNADGSLKFANMVLESGFWKEGNILT